MNNFDLTFICYVLRLMLTTLVCLLVGLFLVIWIAGSDKPWQKVQSDSTREFEEPAWKFDPKDYENRFPMFDLKPNSKAVCLLTGDTVLLLSKVCFLFTLTSGESWEVKYKDKAGVYRTTIFPKASLDLVPDQTD